MLIRSVRDLPAFTAADSCTLRELLNPAEDSTLEGVGYSLAHATVPAKGATVRHKLNSSEVYYMLSGNGLIHIDNETHEVGPGDAVYIPPDAIQFVENPADTPLEFLCIVDPAWIPSCETVLE
jgi:mannose-6-phosphate isomerase-like protein (cupin superfamily)